MNAKTNNSFMSQKMIVDKESGNVSEFIAFISFDFTLVTWLFKLKFYEIISSPDYEQVGHILKAPFKGNPDEGKLSHEGKGISFSESEDNVTITIHTQVYGSLPTTSHTYIVDKALFDAYRLVIKNEADIAEKEKKQKKVSKTFSLS